jgi:hypothetical protein
MRLKAALAILALVSCGMNFSPASLCAFHCGWRGQVRSVRHHQMAPERDREVTSNSADDEQQSADCTACLSNFRLSFRPAADCLSSAQMDMLAETFFSFALSRGVAAIYVAQPFARNSAFGAERGQSRRGAAAAPDRTSVIFPVPLRI